MANYLLTGERSGMWKKVKKEKIIPGGSGGGKFVVTFTENDGTWTADKTVAEIVEAHSAGQTCVAVGDFIGVHNELELSLFITVAQREGGVAGFSGTFDMEQHIPVTVAVMGYNEDDSDSWNCVQTLLAPALPSYSSDDNGKVLGIVDGELAWVNP